MTSINDATLSKILPQNLLADKKLAALAQVLDAELKKLSAETQLVLHLPNLDKLPQEVLDLLAWGFDAIFYQPERMSLDTKRLLIKNSLLDHKIQGTKQAVLNLLNKLTRGAEITEWFEYGGAPYHFKLKLKELRDYEDNGEILMAMIDATKNLRSWLDDILFDLTKQHPDQYLYLAQVEHQLGKIYPANFIKFENNQRLQVVQTQLTAGTVKYKNVVANKKSPQKLQVRFANWTFGRIKHFAKVATDEDARAEFDRWLKERWTKWRKDPIGKEYGDGGDGELEPGEEEIFPTESDFLRIYWSFDCSRSPLHIRYQTILNPKDDLQPADIRYLSDVGVESQLLLHSKTDKPTVGIIRALYIKRNVWKVL